MQFPNPTWLVGCGNMAGAMVEGWRSAGVDLGPTVVIRPSGKPVEGVRTVRTFGEAGAPPRLVILGFKPQKLGEVAPDLSRWLTSKTIVVSLLAGAEAASLRRRLPKAGAIVRAMPNLPVAVRRGVIALFSDEADEEQRGQVSDLFAALGFAMWMESETIFGAVGSVAGSGPAYVARFIAALARAGERRGLPAELAATIAVETALGTGWMAASNGETMDDIARRVASPNGTTEAGLAVLDAELDQLVARTIDASARRSSELAVETGGKVDSGAPLP